MNKIKLPEKFDATYYNEKYFADNDGISFHRPNGSIDKWGYRNPDGEWTGCQPIVQSWKYLFKPKNMLDVGCGRGTFIAYTRDIGIEAKGFDFSEWAINNPYPKCKKEWLKIHDATKPWPYKDRQFDLITILNFIEHIYIDDIEFVIDEIYRCAKKWVFLQITTTKKEYNEKGYIIKKGESIPIDIEGNVVSGNVIIRSKYFWLNVLERKNEWKVRDDLVNQFYKIVPSDIIENWIKNTSIIMERI